MSDSKPDFDKVFESLCQRNDELDRKLDALLRPLGLTRHDLFRAGDLADRVDPLVARKVEQALRAGSAAGDTSWEEVTRCVDTRTDPSECARVPAPHWVRV